MIDFRQAVSEAVLVYRETSETRRSLWVELKGGLGNQLHQYAAGFVLAEELGATLRLSHAEASLVHDGVGLNALAGLSGGALSRFPIHLVPPFSRPYVNALAFRFRMRAAVNRRVTVIDEDAFYSQAFSGEGHDFSLEGYFQDWRTARTAMLKGAFNGIRPRRPSREFLALERDLIAEEPLACIHVRRGDYINSPAWGLLAPKYYLGALESIEGGLGKSSIWCFSDDPIAVKQIFPPEMFPTIRVIDELQTSPAAETLCLMRAFPVKVIANSSLSWWAAMLGAGRVVAPTPWYRKGGSERDRIPPEWSVREAVWHE